mmetsp:Transcript_32224/g.72379  ORF Transcript_32224/g.72379 Transcript_32224/m.72379 type:complete len:597 (-) Transcript_32224:128-1918(-)
MAFDREGKENVKLMRSRTMEISDKEKLDGVEEEQQLRLSLQALSRRELVVEKSEALGMVIGVAVPVRDRALQEAGGMIFLRREERLTYESTGMDEEERIFLTSIAQLLSCSFLCPTKTVHRLLLRKATRAVGGGGGLQELCEAAVGAARRFSWEHKTARAYVAFLIDDKLRLIAGDPPPGIELDPRSSSSSTSIGCGGLERFPELDVAAALRAVRTGIQVKEEGEIIFPLVDARKRNFGLLCLSGISKQGQEHNEAMMQALTDVLSSAILEVDFRRKFFIATESALSDVLEANESLNALTLSFPNFSGQHYLAKLVVRKGGGGGEGEEGYLQQLHEGQAISSRDTLLLRQYPVTSSAGAVAFLGVDVRSHDNSLTHAFMPSVKEVLLEFSSQLSWVAEEIRKEGLFPSRLQSLSLDDDSELLAMGSLSYSIAEQMWLRTHVPVARYLHANQQVQLHVQRSFLDNIRKLDAQLPSSVTRLVQGVMYMLGHKQSEVSEWSTCRKLVSPHLVKEMMIMDVRLRVKKHKFLLAAQAVETLDHPQVAMESGPAATSLFQWLLVMQEVREQAIKGRIDALKHAYNLHNKGAPPNKLIEEEIQ